MRSATTPECSLFSNSAVLFSIVCILGASAIAQSSLIYQPLVPPSIGPGAGAFTLTVRGEGFVLGSAVQWNGKPRSTTFVSSSQLKAAISASDVASAGTAGISVKSPGGQVSNTIFFSITNPISPVTTTRVDYPVSTGYFFASKTLTADVNGDGKLDLLVMNEEYSVPGYVSVLLGNGDGTFQLPTTYPVGNSSSDMVAVDVNGDKRVDLVGVDGLDNTVSVLLGNGDGTFQTRAIYPAGQDPAGITFGDFNRDGTLDLVITNAGNGISILLGNGDGTFQAPVPTAEPGAFGTAAVGDFNGDSKLDVVVGNFSTNGNMIYVMLGNGDGTFQTPVGYLIPYYGPDAVGVADVNGDGQLDLSVVGTYLAILTGKGDGTFKPAVMMGTEALMNNIVFGDFNGDGKIDIGGGGLNSALYYLGNGDGTFQDPISLGLIITGEKAAFGDFNRDGALDLVSGGASFFFNKAPAFAPQANLSSSALNFGSVKVGQSKSLNLTISNGGNAPLNISDIEVQGLARNSYKFTAVCITDIFPGQTCTFPVTFTPTTATRVRGFMDITDNATGSPQVVKLVGFGTN